MWKMAQATRVLGPIHKRLEVIGCQVEAGCHGDRDARVVGTCRGARDVGPQWETAWVARETRGGEAEGLDGDQ